MKASKELPGPANYNTNVDRWQSPRGKFLEGKRETSFDEIQKRSKSIPGPSAYIPKKINRVLGGKLDKTEDISYLTTGEYHARNLPGVGKYSPNMSAIQPRSPSHVWKRPKRILKKLQQDKVGPGLYNHSE